MDKRWSPIWLDFSARAGVEEQRVIVQRLLQVPAQGPVPSFAIAGLPAGEQSDIWRGQLCMHSTQCCPWRRGIRSLTEDEQRLLSHRVK